MRTADDTTFSVWRVEANEKHYRTIPVVDSNGNPNVVTGWTVDAKVRTRAGGEILYVFPEEHWEIQSDLVILKIPAPVSAAWDWSLGWYRVVITDPNSDAEDPDTQRIAEGPFIVNPD
jgi:hypothetical protein